MIWVKILCGAKERSEETVETQHLEGGEQIVAQSRQKTLKE